MEIQGINLVANMSSIEYKTNALNANEFQKLFDKLTGGEIAQEIKDKSLEFSESAQAELKAIIGAVDEIVTLTLDAFIRNDAQAATLIEPLEQVVDVLKKKLRANHILRLQKGHCSIECGFVWADILTNLERVSDHCSNIAVCIIEMAHDSMDIHQYLTRIKAGDPEFEKMFAQYSEKYTIPASI